MSCFDLLPKDRITWVVVLASVLGSCASASNGPDVEDLASALAASGERGGSVFDRLRCQRFEEEPTEAVCTWRQPGADGTWERWRAHLAIDRNGWALIDGVERLDPP